MLGIARYAAIALSLLGSSAMTMLVTAVGTSMLQLVLIVATASLTSGRDSSTGTTFAQIAVLPSAWTSTTTASGMSGRFACAAFNALLSARAAPLAHAIAIPSPSTRVATIP